MHDLIPRALEWLRLLFAPGTGKRRRCRPRRHFFPHVHLTFVSCPSALVRPYLAAHEQEVALQRRPALEVAA